MSQHTRGPWKVMPGSLSFSRLLVRAPEGDKAIADCDYQAGAEGEANAKLIAAAPDLLKALEIAEATIIRLNRHDSANGTLDVIRAAFKKAGKL